MRHAPRRHAIALALVLAFAALSAPPVAAREAAGRMLSGPAHAFSAAPPDFSWSALAAAAPEFREIAALARRHGVTVGFWGGPVRDLYLKREFTVISDLDLLYDSREPGFPAFRDALIERASAWRGKIPFPDFHFDLADLGTANPRLRLYHEEGITATKVGSLVDGRIYDPTGRGVADLRSKTFRYHPIERGIVPPENIGRFVRDFVRLHALARDPATVDLLARSVARAAEDPAMRRSAARLRKELAEGGIVPFPRLIGPLRNDLRHLHHDRRERLSPHFPADFLLGDLFRSVTQADDMTSMRETLATLGIPACLARLGLGGEAALLMDPALSREDLFARFRFPGYDPERPPADRIEAWERALRRYNYRTLFDMLASEFPAGSREGAHLARRRDDFLKPSAYRMLNPGDDWADTVEGFLDTDFSIGLLPRERCLKSLAWFASTYLPGGATLLSPVPEPIPPSPRTAALLRRGFSPNVTRIDRAAPHAFPDLDAYLALQTGPELADLLRDPGCGFAFLDLDVREAAGLLAALGYRDVRSVNACGFARRKRTLLARNPADGRVILCTVGFHSPEDLTNVEARYYLLRRGRGDTVYTLRDPARPFPAQAEFERFLAGLGEPPAALFAGFTTPLRSILKDVRTERVGDVGVTVGRLPESGRPVLALSAFGANYGAFPARVLDLLPAGGPEAVVYLGTAGGIGPGGERFGFTLPDAVEPSFGAEAGRRIAFTNAALGAAIPHARGPVAHVTVETPLEETQAFVRAARGRAIRSVDCELWHLVRALARRDGSTRLYAALNVTDFPDPGDERRRDRGGILAENDRTQGERVERALRAIVADLERGGRARP